MDVAAGDRDGLQYLQDFLVRRRKPKKQRSMVSSSIDPSIRSAVSRAFGR